MPQGREISDAAAAHGRWLDAITAPWYKRTRAWATGRLLLAEFVMRRGIGALPPPDPTREAILLVNHFFDGEIASLEGSPEFARRFQSVPLGHRTFFRANWSFFPAAIWRGDMPYDDASNDAARRRSRAYAQSLLRRLKARYRIAAVATPSDAFFWVREFIQVAADEGIRTFVFDKEGVVSPATFDHQPGVIARQYPPIAGRFYLWNERQTRYWSKAGLPHDRMHVVGSLRTDLFVRMRPATRKAILLFDFDTWAYLEDLADPVATAGGWHELKSDIHDVINRAIRSFPDVSFTIKCHPQQTDLAMTRQRFEHAGTKVSVLTGSMDVHRIVEGHSLVIGFQTTGLLETALTNRPAIYCGWGPLHDQVHERLLPLMEPGFGQIVCGGADHLYELIERHVRGDSVRPADDRSRLGEYFHLPDGRVAARYAAALERDLAANRQEPS